MACRLPVLAAVNSAVAPEGVRISMLARATTKSLSTKCGCPCVSLPCAIKFSAFQHGGLHALELRLLIS